MFVQIDRVEFVAGLPDTPSGPAVVVLNPEDEITPESFTAWLDRRQAENRSIPEYGLLTVSPKHAPLARCEPSRHRRLRWRRAGSRYATRASATDVVAHRRSALGARAVLRRVRSGAAPMGPEPHPDTRPDRSGHRWADGLARCASPRCAGCSPTHGGYAQTLPSLTRYTWRSPRTLAPTSFLMMADWPTPLARQFGSCTCRTDS